MLHLIAKHKLNINDISITELLEQYLDYIERIKLADLEVASEFLAMAAHLVYIKSVHCCPTLYKNALSNRSTQPVAKLINHNNIL